MREARKTRVILKHVSKRAVSQLEHLFITRRGPEEEGGGGGDLGPVPLDSQ